jgi:hypothetical protein
VKELAHRGFAVVRGFLSSEELELARSAAAALLAPHQNLTDLIQLPRPSLGELAFFRIVFERIGSLAAGALGVERPRLLQDVLLHQAPSSSHEVHWHQDVAFFEFLSGAETVSIRIALDHEHEDNGAMRVATFSHSLGVVVPVRATNWFIEPGALDALSPELRDRIQVETVELAPGDASVHLGRTFHRSGPNRTSYPRRTLVVHAFAGDALSPLRHPSLVP